MLISDKFNEYFTSIGPKLAEHIPQVAENPIDYMRGSHTNSIFLVPVTTGEINRIIDQFKNCGSGWDNIKPSIIKQTCSTMLEPLCYIFNMSFSKGCVPNQLKIAKVTPVFKNGDPSLIHNYRPISVLPVFSKIYERLMYNRLMDYVTKNNILSKYQFGFRKGYSTDMALTILIDKITSAMDKGEHIIGLFVDLAKAFDTVNHTILLKKLTHYGIRGTALQWIHSYLSERQQSVKFNGNNSTHRNITCGVPQGSILGPLLFFLYINDLSAVSDITFPIMFADDTNLFIQGKDPNEMELKLTNEIAKLTNWLKANKLSLNINKTHTVNFSKSHNIRTRQNNIIIDGKAIETVNYTKFL